MALGESAFNQFRAELRRASQALGSTELIYRTAWIYEFPTASLSIAGVLLHEQFNIPVGLAGYGDEDLAKLTIEGFLLKVDESAEDPVTLEKCVTYQLVIQR